MPRPRKERLVNRPPVWKAFRAVGRRGRGGSVISLSLDEYEAVRLADYEGLEHADAATEMEISRPTFTRLIEDARKKTAALLVEGRDLVIDGGSIHFKGNVYRCIDCYAVINSEIDSVVEECTNCGSKNLFNVAEGFGHGRCCRGHGKGKRGF